MVKRFFYIKMRLFGRFFVKRGENLEIFKLFGSIFIDDKDASQKITDMDKKGKGFASTLGSGIKTAAKWGAGIASAAGAAAIAIGTKAVQASDEYKKALNGLRAETGLTDEAVSGFGQSLKNIYANNFGESFEDIADAMGEVRNQTGEVGKALEETTTNALMLRDTFGFEVNESVRAAKMLMDQFGVSSEDAYNLIAQGAQNGLDKNGDLLDTINEYGVHFKQLGFSSEEMFNMLANGAAAGTFSVDKLGDSVKEFGIRVKDGTADDAFAALGLSVDKTKRAFLEGGEAGKKAFGDVTKALFAMKDPVQQNQLGVMMFGTMWEDLGKDGVRAMTELTGAVSLGKDALAQINEVKYDDFGSAIQGVGRMLQTNLLMPLGDELLPILTDMANGFMKAGTDAAAWADVAVGAVMQFLTLATEKLPEFMEFGAEIITGLATGIVQALPAVMEAATLCIVGLVNSISAQLPVLMPLAVSALMQIVQGLVNNIPMLTDAALQLILGLANGLIAAIPVLIEALPTIITSLAEGIYGALPQIIEAGIALVTALAEELPEIIAQLVEAIPQIIDGIITAITENYPLIMQAGMDLFLALIEALPEIIVSITSAMPQIITSIVGALVDGIPRLIEMGVQLFVALVENLPTIIIEICKAAPQIVSGLVSAFQNLASKMWDIGKNLLMGIWTGIQNAKDWLLGKIKEWAGSILDGIKGFFGIQSPSKYTAEYGRYLAEGLAVGIKDGEQYVITAVDELADNVLEGLKKALDGLDLFADRADLEYEFWEKTAGIAASDAQKDEKRLKTANKKLEAQTEAVKNAEAAYWKMVELTGEESAESQELYNDLLQAKIDLADLEAERKEIADRMSQAKTDDVNAKYAEFEKLLAEGQSLKNYGYTDSQIAEWAAKTSGYTQAGQAQAQQINKTIEMTNNFYSNALTPSRVAQEEEAAMRRAALAF